jgi:GGDEF domain-containing protein
LSSINSVSEFSDYSDHAEEVDVIMSATDAMAAVHVAEKLRRNLYTLDLPDGTSAVDSRVTLSAGVATITPDASGQPTDLDRSSRRSAVPRQGKRP